MLSDDDFAVLNAIYLTKMATAGVIAEVTGLAGDAADARLAERRSMLFKGTAVTRGSGAGVVTATGLHSELGRVSQLVEEAAAGSSPLPASSPWARRPSARKNRVL